MNAATKDKASGNPFAGLKWYEHVVSALPLVMVLLGGAIGGACGGAAYALSATVFKSGLPTALKYVFSLMISFGAVALYFTVVLLLSLAFPDFFKR